MSPAPAPDEKEAKEIAAIKMALTYKFIKFIEWPDSCFKDEKSPIVIGVVGKDPFGETLDKTFKGKTQGSRSFRIERYATYEDIGACHILFVPESEKKNHAAINAAVAGKHVLQIGDWTGFAAEGGIINFYLEETKGKDGKTSVKIKFEINADQAKEEKIKISSQLLKLARPVKNKEEDEKEKPKHP